MKPLITYCVAFLFLVLVPLTAVAATVSEPEFRTGAHCDNQQDYERAKQGTFAISGIGLAIEKQHLVVTSRVATFQCQQLKQGQYRWVSVKPTQDIHYSHH